MTRTGRQGGDKPKTFGPANVHPNLLTFENFRFYAVRPGLSDSLLPNVEACSWDDGAPNRGAITTGSITLRDPAYGLGPKVHVELGNEVRCECNVGHGFAELWTMRVDTPNLSEYQGQRTFDLANDLDLLARSVDDFYFQAGKGTGHPNGWTADQVIRFICDAYGVKIGAMPKFTYKRKKSWSHRNASPLLVIQTALNVDRQHTGRRVEIRWVKGALWILPLRRSPDLIGLGATLVEAAFSQHLANGVNAQGINEGYFASAVTVRGLKNAPLGKDKQGHVKQTVSKIHAVVESQASISRYGYVRRVVWSPDAKTDADLVEQARQYLAAVAKPLKDLTLTHHGIPTIRRGDAIKLGLGDTALRSQVVWVTEAAFSLTPADFTMVLTVTFDDPYVDKVAKRIQDQLGLTQKQAGHIKKKNTPKPKTANQGKDASKDPGGALSGAIGGFAPGSPTHTGGGGTVIGQ